MNYINKYIAIGLSIGLSFIGTNLSFGLFKDIEHQNYTIRIKEPSKATSLTTWEIKDENISLSTLEVLSITDELLTDKYTLNIPYKLSQ